MLIVISVVVLIAALVHHLIAAKVNGGGSKASDHIRNAPVLKGIYDKAEIKFFDPYELGVKFVIALSKLFWWIDRAVDWLYDGLSVGFAFLLGNGIRIIHTGNYSLYVAWSLIGAVVILILLL